MLEDLGKEKKNEAAQEVSGRASRLGPGTTVTGEISCEEDLVIEGRFQGKILMRDHNLTVSPEGKTEAEIQAGDVVIRGEVNGDIYASGKVFISREGRMKGDILASKVSIMDGAQFCGRIKMETDPSKIFPAQEPRGEAKSFS